MSEGLGIDVDLIADLNAEDDDGLGWSTLADAASPERIAPDALVLAGNQSAQAVVRIVAVDDDGQVHFIILPGSVAKTGPKGRCRDRLGLEMYVVGQELRQMITAQRSQ